MWLSSSASSRKSLKSSSHMSNKVNRELCRLAVDALKSEEKTSGGGRNVTIEGEPHPKLLGEIGKNNFERYCAEPPILSLQKIYYCQRRLEQLKMMATGSLESSKKELKESSGEEVTAEEAQEIQKRRGLINHEYLVLEVQSSPSDKLYILAEKVGGKGQAGIYTQVAEPADYDEKNVVLLKIDCGGVPMKLDSLESLLMEADTPHYNLRDHNCWDYATSATKRLLMECIAKVSRGGDKAKTARLQRALQDLEANLNSKNIVKTWERVCGWLSRRR